jgi:hypothetical protein
MPRKFTYRQEWIMKYLATSDVLRAGGSKPNPIGAAYRKANLLDRTQASDSALACDSLKRLVKEGFVKKHAGGVYALVALRKAKP